MKATTLETLAMIATLDATEQQNVHALLGAKLELGLSDSDWMSTMSFATQQADAAEAALV